LRLSVAGELACRIGDEAGEEAKRKRRDLTRGAGRSPIPWLVGLVGGQTQNQTCLVGEYTHDFLSCEVTHLLAGLNTLFLFKK
jgi:hypothetical protein